MNIPWTHIMLHHSLTKDGPTVSWDAIRRYHISLGWSDIGYHFGVEMVGLGFCVMEGRTLDKPGAHCKGMNKKAIGICFVGNFDIESPLERQLLVGAGLVRGLLSSFSIPITNLVCHRDYAPKSCPGNLFPLEDFKKLLCI